MRANSEFEIIFYIRDQHQIDICHYLQFCLLKRGTHSLTIGLLWQQIKSQMNKTTFLNALYVDSNILKVSLSYC